MLSRACGVESMSETRVFFGESRRLRSSSHERRRAYYCIHIYTHMRVRTYVRTLGRAGPLFPGGHVCLEVVLVDVLGGQAVQQQGRGARLGGRGYVGGEGV